MSKLTAASGIVVLGCLLDCVLKIEHSHSDMLIGLYEEIVELRATEPHTVVDVNVDLWINNIVATVAQG